MNLSRPSIAYMAELMAYNMSGTKLRNLLEKIDEEPRNYYNLVQTKEERWRSTLIKLNHGDKLQILLHKACKEYLPEDEMNNLNHILNQSGYSIDENCGIHPQLPEQIKFPEKQSEIEYLLTLHGFSALKDFQDAVDDYSKGGNRASGKFRIVMQGLVEEIIEKRGFDSTGNMKDDFIKLESMGILKPTPQNRGSSRLEVDFSYSLFGLSSFYGNHPNDVSEEDMHFTVFELVALIWLILKRFQLTASQSSI